MYCNFAAVNLAQHTLALMKYSFGDNTLIGMIGVGHGSNAMQSSGYVSAVGVLQAPMQAPIQAPMAAWHLNGWHHKCSAEVPQKIGRGTLVVKANGHL